MSLRLPRWEALLLILALLALVLGTVLDWAVLHPGYVTYDEEANIALLQWFREQSGLLWGPGYGSLHRSLMLLSVSLLGPTLSAAHLPGILLGCATLFLLAAWGARLGSARAGAWAAFLVLGSVLPWVHARCLLSYAAVPAELLLALWFLPKCGAGVLRALVTGLVLSLLVLDYELWFYGVGVLFLFWLVSERPTWAEALAGIVGGLLGILFLAKASAFDLGSYWHVRQAHTISGAADLGSGLGRWFSAVFKSSPTTLPFMGAADQPWAPRWLWIPALAGLYFMGRKGWPWAILLLLGLAPAWALSPTPEPQRLLLALPPLCLLAGWGLDRLAPKEGRLPKALALGLLLLAIPAWLAFQSSQAKTHVMTYGASFSRLQGVRALEKTMQDRPVHVLSDLDSTSGLILRFHLDASRLKQDPQGLIVLPVAWEFIPQGPPRAWGPWLVAPGYPALPEQYWVLGLAPGPRASLAKDEALLKDFWPRFAGASGTRARQLLCESVLDAQPGPWARTVVAVAWLSACRNLGVFPKERLDALVKQPLLGGQVQEEAARFYYQREPAQALSLAQAACRADPRRLEAWQLWETLLLEAGKPKEAAAVRAQLQALLDRGKHP